MAGSRLKIAKYRQEIEMKEDKQSYLHGFSSTEQARLVKQARIAESTIFRNIDYTGVR